MSSFKDRQAKQVNPVESAVLGIAGKAEPTVTVKKKYAVNVLFDGDMEAAIRAKAEEKRVGVATYIKMLVNEDLNKGNSNE